MNNTQSIPAANPLLLRLGTGIAALALLAGCASTGKKVSKQSGTANVRNLCVAVVVRKNLEVLNATEDSAFLGAFLLGLVGDEIQQGARRAQDAKTADPMRRRAGDDEGSGTVSRTQRLCGRWSGDLGHDGESGAIPGVVV